MEEVVKSLVRARDIAGALDAANDGAQSNLSSTLSSQLLQLALVNLGQESEKDIIDFFVAVESRFELGRLNDLALLAQIHQKPRVGTAICYRSIWRNFNQGSVHLLLSKHLWATGAEAVSIHHARIAVALEPQCLDHRLHLSKLLQSSNRIIEASAALLDAVAYLATSSDIVLFLAEVEDSLFQDGLIAVDLDIFTRILNLSFSLRNWRLVHFLIESVIRQDDLYLKVVAHAELSEWWNDGETWRRIWPQVRQLRQGVSLAIADRMKCLGKLENPEEKRAVVIILSTFRGNIHHPILRFVLETAVSISAEKRIVYVLVTDEVGSEGSESCSASHQELIQEYCESFGVGASIQMVYMAPPRKNKTYVEDVCGKILEINPAVVLTYHQGYENSFIFADFIRTRYPLVYQQTNRFQLPDFKADLYLSCASDIDFARQAFPEAEKWQYQQTGFTPFKQHAVYTRDELGMGQNCLVLVTVGNRLQSEVGRLMLEAMLQLASTDIHFEWWLLGIADADKINAFHELAVEDREKLRRVMRFRPFEVHLRAFYQHVDIYVNPRRAGGGFSIMSAISEGIPVVSFVATDVDNASAGYFVKDDAEYVSLLMKLARSRDERLRIGREMQEVARSTYDSRKAARAFLDAFRLAKERHINQRRSVEVA